MIKHSFLLSVFLLFINIIQAQNISGTVFDAYSNKPLASATVTINNLDNATSQTVTTNANGAWNIADYATYATNNTALPQIDISAYPNPFTYHTTFSFRLPQASYAQIFVYNQNGQLIDKHSGNLTNGQHTYKWEGSNSSGLYFITLQTQYGVFHQKIVQLSNGNKNTGFSKTETAIKEKQKKRSDTFSAQIIIDKYAYYPDTLYKNITDGIVFDTGISTIHRYSLFADMHNDVLMKCLDNGYQIGTKHSYNHTDIPRLQEGGVDIQVFAVYNNSATPYQTAKQMIEIFHQEMETNSTEIEQAFTANDALQITSENKIAAVLAIEGGHMIDGSIDKLTEFYNEGARYMTITWNNSTNWAVSAKDARSETVGLSETGRGIIRKMDELGMIIDVSHTGIKTIEDILTETQNPIIASHSGVRYIKEHYRNLYDEQIYAIAQTGGVIGVPFYPYFLGSGNINTSDVVDHINYIVDLVGVEHVGIGSDFDGIGVTPGGLSDVSHFPTLTMALIQEGYSIDEIEKIAGGNFLRVFNVVCTPKATSK